MTVSRTRANSTLKMPEFIRRAKYVIEREGYRVLFLRAWWNIICVMRIQGVVRTMVVNEFVDKMRNVTTMYDAVGFAYRHERFGITIHPIQNRVEIEQLLRLLVERRPDTVLEIGTLYGGTLFLFSRVASEKACLFSIDIGRSADHVMLRLPLYRSFGTAGQKIIPITGDSHDPKTVLELERLLKGRCIDFLFIDGDHSEEGVKKDFETYSRFVAKGGIIALHDIRPDYYVRVGIHNPSFGGGEVYRFWEQLKQKEHFVEFIENPAKDGRGIGVIFR
jgi:cephalosporin hydroxylase